MCDYNKQFSKIEEIISQFNNQWRKYYPTSSHLNGGLHAELIGIDQLSDNSFSTQSQIIREYQKKANEIKIISQYDKSIRTEFLRTLAFKKYSLDNSKYKVKLKPYLDLIILNLLYKLN